MNPADRFGWPSIPRDSLPPAAQAELRARAGELAQAAHDMRPVRPKPFTVPVRRDPFLTPDGDPGRLVPWVPTRPGDPEIGHRERRYSYTGAYAGGRRRRDGLALVLLAGGLGTVFGTAVADLLVGLADRTFWAFIAGALVALVAGVALWRRPRKRRRG